MTATAADTVGALVLGIGVVRSQITRLAIVDAFGRDEAGRGQIGRRWRASLDTELARRAPGNSSGEPVTVERNPVA